MHESGEMYLETIFVLSKKQENVRSIDICDHMGYSKPSVSRAVGLLKKAGHITVDDNGMNIAKTIYERHTILTGSLVALGVSEETASQDACKIEHVLSDETFAVIKEHYNKYLK